MQWVGLLADCQERADLGNLRGAHASSPIPWRTWLQEQDDEKGEAFHFIAYLPVK